MVRLRGQCLKRLLALLLCVFTAACLCSCYIGADAKPRRQERKTALKVFKYIKNENIDKLVDLFAEDTKDNYDVEEEWEDFFDFIDGHIVSYGDLEVTASEVWFDHWKRTYTNMMVVYEDVVTDEGTVYKKLIYCHIIVDEDKDMVGINAFELIDSDGESVAVVGGY